jgi:uncharacterized membrane protein YhaH (DUF805 family)
MADPLSQFAARLRRNATGETGRRLASIYLGLLLQVLAFFFWPFFFVLEIALALWRLRRWLFAVAGRVPRQLFWRSIALLVGYGVVVAVIIDLATVDRGGSPRWRDALRLALVALPIAAVLITVGIRRLHDRDKTAWWLLLFYALPVGLIGLSYATPLSVLVSGLLPTILFAWAAIELGCVRGSKGPNRFGPDPWGAAARSPLRPS